MPKDSSPPTTSPAEGGQPPVVFETPTLGHSVCLGELYDQRSGKFLGVQLYPQAKVQEVVTDIRNTDLTLSASNTHKEKASLLDISAKLSLDVLSGLVKVSGSGKYLRDEKSNTHEHAYALALKVRLTEKRILFAESDLGHNILPVTQQDYITTHLATHFVSSIVYGGNFIVNLVAKESQSSKNEKIQGKLQASFDKLKGAISLDGSVEATIKGGFNDMDDKFDLVIHGDVALDKVPINPKDVLDVFPEAASLISENGGVPVSVTLQPIPPTLYTGGLVFQLDKDFVDDVLNAFSMLDDLSSRFLVLRNNVKSLQDFVPELARTIRIVADAYTKGHSRLSHELGKFLQEYQRGGKAGPNSVFSSEDPTNITGDKVLKTATDLYEKHLDPNGKDEKISKLYPSSLAGLENEFSRFRDFVSDIQKSLQVSTSPSPANLAESSSYLSNVDDICRAIRIHSEISLFVMTPIASVGSNPDLAIIHYLAILRKYATFFDDPANHTYLLYAENLGNLENRLPNNGKFSSLTTPSLFAGKVDDDGKLTWSPVSAPSSPAVLAFPINHQPASGLIGHLSLSLDPVNGTQSFSVQIRAKNHDPLTNKTGTVLVLECAGNNSRFLKFEMIPLGVSTRDTQIGYTRQKHEAGGVFVGTFVQDIQAKQWILYLDGEEIHRAEVDDDELVPEAKNLQIGYPDPDPESWWSGQLLEVKAFARALTPGEVKNLYSASAPN